MKDEISVIITVHQIGLRSPVRKMLSSLGEKKKAAEKSMNCQKWGKNCKAILSALPKGYFIK